MNLKIHKILTFSENLRGHRRACEITNKNATAWPPDEFAEILAFR